MKIDSFSGKYRFLSNFYPCNVILDGIEYPSTENAYQAAKTLDHCARKRYETCTAGQAKRHGRLLQLRSDWEQVKIGIMLELLRKKFASGAIRDQLIATGDAELIEGNWWHDQYWGVCGCASDGTCARKGGVGKNMLGKLLMQVRDELRKCSDGCGASSDDHCWNRSTSGGEDITVGDVVSFDDCVGYVDSVEKAMVGFVANVVALKRKPGDWKAFGNPSIQASCYRVPLAQLKKMQVREELRNK